VKRLKTNSDEQRVAKLKVTMSQSWPYKGEIDMVKTAASKSTTTAKPKADGFEERAARAEAAVKAEQEAKLKKDAQDAIRGVDEDPLGDLDEVEESTKPKVQKHLYNKCEFIGNLGRDAEMNYTPGGKCVSKISVAVWQGEGKPAMWIRCTFWEELAEKFGAILEKGDRVWVRGKLSYREWKTEDGNKGSAYELTVTECEVQ